MSIIFFVNNHTQNKVDKLALYQNWAYNQINNVKYYWVCFTGCPNGGLLK